MEEDNSDEIKFISSQTYIIEQILSKLPECIETRWQEKMDSEDCFSELWQIVRKQADNVRHPGWVYPTSHLWGYQREGAHHDDENREQGEFDDAPSTPGKPKKEKPRNYAKIVQTV